jgi:hypothetical protein
MRAKVIGFGKIEVEGQLYDYDLVIEQGRVSKRSKKASKPYRDQFGHTPLSAGEHIPWDGERLIIGTGVYGKLPVMQEVYDEALKRGVEVVAVPTQEACDMLQDKEDDAINAILHVTC